MRPKRLPASAGPPLDGRAVWNVTPSPPPHYLSLLTMSLLTPAGDQLVVRGGNAHFSTYTRIRSRETGENKTDEQTRTKLGVNQEQKKVCKTTCMCIPDSRYGLTLAWVTSENSTMLLESDILRLFFTGPYLVSWPLCSVSGVDYPSVLPRQLLLFASLLSSRNSSLSCPATNSSAGLQPPTPSRVQPPTPLCSPATNSHSPPRTTSGYGEISGPRILCLVSRQNRQLNRLLWQPTPIVLHCNRDKQSMSGRLEAKRPPASIGPSSGGRVASLIPLSPLFSTGPYCPVYAIIKHTCLDPELGPCPASSSGPYCTKLADEQHSPAGLEPWLITDLPLH